MPYDWLWAVAHTDAYTDKVTGFDLYPNAREIFAQIEKWTLAPYAARPDDAITA